MVKGILHSEAGESRFKSCCHLLHGLGLAILISPGIQRVFQACSPADLEALYSCAACCDSQLRMVVTAQMEVFIRQQKCVLLCSEWALHTLLCYPGSAFLELLILPGSLQAVQARVSSFHGQPTESWETSSCPQEVSTSGSPHPSPCWYPTLTWASHYNPFTILVSTHLFLKLSSATHLTV